VRVMRRARSAVLVAAAVAALSPLASVRPAVADDRPQIVDVTDHCPVPEGGYRYGSDFFEYRIRVSLAGCPWYHGEAVTVRGRLVRTDPLTGPEEYDAIVLCEPGAPAGDDRPHDHQPTFGPPPVAEPAPAVPAPTGGAEAHQSEARRPPTGCVLSIVVPHPPVEHARYEGELRYPSGLGEQHESLALDCTTVEDFGGCDPPGSPPGISPPPGVVPGPG